MAAGAPDTTALEDRIAESIERTYRTGEIPLPDRPPFALAHYISPEVGRTLRDLVTELRPKRTIEIGMGSGLSGLHICWGLIRAWAGAPAWLGHPSAADGVRHLAIDPFQTSEFWQGVGLALRNQAGCDQLFHWSGDRDDSALPALMVAGEQFEFALIDGDHRIEAVMLDFYYIDRMMRVGGVCVFDDADLPPVRRVIRFAMRHRNYEWVDAVPVNLGPITRPWGWRLRARRWSRFYRNRWSLREALSPHRPYQIVVLRKVAEDHRPHNFWASLE